jgi:hypothetical protein
MQARSGNHRFAAATKTVNVGSATASTPYARSPRRRLASSAPTRAAGGPYSHIRTISCNMSRSNDRSAI